MIKSIKVTNHLGASIVMDLGEPEKSGFLIRSIDGLGPVKSTINTSDYSLYDGAMYNSARMPYRNIVLDLAFMWKPDIETTRHLSYKYFPIKRRVKLEIETDQKTVQTYGYVESNEPNIFSKEEGSTISIICPDPYLYASGENETQRTDQYDVEPEFHFEFASSTSNPNTLVMGEIYKDQSYSIIVDYPGELEVGFVMCIKAIGAANGITVQNDITNEKIVIDHNLSAGDSVYISTVPGDLYATLVNSLGSETNIINKVYNGTDWFRFISGANFLSYSAVSGVDNLSLSFKNKIAYEGV